MKHSTTNNTPVQLKEVPFRLPSLFPKKQCDPFVRQTILCRHYQRHQLFFQKVQPDFHDLPDNQKYKGFHYPEKERDFQSFIGLLFNNNEEDFHKSFNNQSKRFIFTKQMGLDIRGNEINGIPKPIWISEIKSWLERNSVPVEFIKLATTATIFGSELSTNSFAKENRMEEIRKCERFLKHFHLKDMIAISEKMRSKYRKSKRRFRTVDISREIERILEEKDEYELNNRDKDLEKFRNRRISVSNKYLTENESDETGPLIDQEESDTKSLLEDIPSITGSEEIDRKIRNISESSDYDEFEGLTKYNRAPHIDDKENDSRFVEEEVPQIMMNDVRDDDENNTTIPIVYEDENDTSSTCHGNHEGDIQTLNNQQEFIEKTVDPFRLDSQFILQESKNFNESPIPVRKRIEMPRRVLFEKDDDENLEDNIVKDMKVDDGSIISSDENISREQSSEIARKPIIQLPPLPAFSDAKSSNENKCDRRVNSTERDRDKLAPLLKKEKRKWGKKNTDLSYLNDMQRERLAEERKLRAEKLNKKPKERKSEPNILIPDAPRFETYGFLAKYCILKKTSVALYHNTFEQCDEEGKKWLTSSQLMIALKGVNPNLKDYDITYMNMVMKTCDYDMRSGADFKLFAILAALSAQISTLDSWIRNTVGVADFKILEKKTYICRKLWEVNVEPSTKTIPLERLCVELKAGGVKERHIEEVRQRIGWMRELNLLDYFTYIPLFIMMHLSIIDNPLDMSEKI